MSKHPDLIVVGGGVIGLSCAWKLAEQGLKVMILERERCNSAASSASLGVLAPPNPLSRQPMVVAHRRSLNMFPAFAEEIKEASGEKVFYQRIATMEILPSQHQLEMADKETAFVAKERNNLPDLPDLKLITQKEVQAMEPDVTTTEFGAILCQSAAQVSVEGLLSGLLGCCKKTGVEIRHDSNVEKLVMTNGKITGVELKDQLISCSAVLVAAGAWTPLLSAELQRFAAIVPVRGQGLILKTEKHPVRHIVKWQRCYIIPRCKGEITLGSTTERNSGFDQRTTVSGINQILTKAVSVLPLLGELSIKKMWAGLRPSPLDRKPFIGAIPAAEGLYVASGHYKIGFGYAPLTARAVSEIIIGGSVPELIQAMAPREQEKAA